MIKPVLPPLCCNWGDLGDCSQVYLLVLLRDIVMRIAYLEYYLRVKVKTPYARRKMTLQVGEWNIVTTYWATFIKGCSQFNQGSSKVISGRTDESKLFPRSQEASRKPSPCRDRTKQFSKRLLIRGLLELDTNVDEHKKFTEEWIKKFLLAFG